MLLQPRLECIEDSGFSPRTSTKDNVSPSICEAETVLGKLDNFSIGSSIGKENSSKPSRLVSGSDSGRQTQHTSSANRGSSPSRTRRGKPPPLTISALTLPPQASRSLSARSHATTTTATTSASDTDSTPMQSARSNLTTARSMNGDLLDSSRTAPSLTASPVAAEKIQHTRQRDIHSSSSIKPELVAEAKSSQKQDEELQLVKTQAPLPPLPPMNTTTTNNNKNTISNTNSHSITSSLATTPEPAPLASLDSSRSTPMTARSPGAILRQQSAASPSPHPLPDLLHLTADRHVVPMESLILSMASLSRAGREQLQRKINQDSVFAYKHFLKPYQALCGVMDGHGPNGHTVSAYTNKQLPSVIANQLRKRGELEVADILHTAFTETNETLKSGAPKVNAKLSGTTAVISLLQGTKLVTAWVGDSKAMLVREDEGGIPLGVPLTEDHKPNLETEYSRIMANGGRVERLCDGYGQEVGPHRVWLSESWLPGLAMSRTIGDLLAQSVGVIPEPDVHTIELSHTDKFLVLASDGVWEFMSVQEAADIVHGCDSAEEACTELVNAASLRWERIGEGVVDDISVVAVRFCSKTIKTVLQQE